MSEIIFDHIPGSKSIAQRALICAALCHTPTILKNVPNGDDVQNLIKALSQCGTKFKKIDSTTFETIPGKSTEKKITEIFVEHGGTPFRFLLSFLCLIPGTQTLNGSSRLQKRPMQPLIEALNLAGAKISSKKFPLSIGYSSLKKEITINSNKSSQFLSSLLLSGKALGIEKINTVGDETSSSYLKLTKKVLADFGVTVVKTDKKYTFKGNYVSPNEYVIEPDWASAGYILGASMLSKISGKIPFLNPNSLQPDAGILPVLKKMGLKVIETNKDLAFSCEKIICPKKISCEAFPDSAQTIAILASFCDKKTTTLTGLQTLPLKECNRIEALKSELAKMGIKTQTTNKSLTLFGGTPIPAEIETFHDHRMGMAFGMVRVLFSEQKIDDCSVVSKSFPAFWNVLSKFKKSTTKKIAVIGDPISHSLTPLLYNAAFAELGKNILCEKKQVSLEKSQKFLSHNSYQGLAITAPNKKKCAKFVDKITGFDSKKIIGINSLKYKDQKSIGTNTDLIGFREILPGNIHPGQKVLILGAGDTAASVLDVLSLFNGNIFVLNRTTSKANSLAKNYDIQILKSPEEAEKISPEIVLSTLPFDTEPEFSEKFFESLQTIFCVGYGQNLPKILQKSQEKNKTIRTGGDLLFAQWKFQFEFLFSFPPPLKNTKKLLNVYTPLTR